jgi:hypothetical protein
VVGVEKEKEEKESKARQGKAWRLVWCVVENFF